MNSTEVESYRKRLKDMLAELAEHDALGQDSQKTVVLDQQSTGRLSRMDALQHQAMAKAQQLRRNQSEQRIRAALARIDEGEFGYCLDCGEEISADRLDFDPTIPRCLSCASG